MRRLLAALLAVPFTLVPTPARAAAPTYDVTIVRTEHGTPHITGKDFASVGYGYAYAFAQDDICVMADDYVTVDAQRSATFGPTKSYTQGGNGVSPNNLNSDVFWQGVIDSRVIDRQIAQPPPLGPEQDLKDLVRGYVAGWNRQLDDIGGTNGVSDPACKGQSWVRHIDEGTVYRRFYQLTLLASQSVAIDGIGGAQPPTPGSPASGVTSVSDEQLAQALADKLKTLAIGSNAVAVGKAGTADHTHGLLLGNPHFPWVGTERFYQAQLTIPGHFDVEGASLFGVPAVLIGHTQNMAWSHTVSTAYRFTPYQLTLVPGTPTSYLQDGVPTPMTSRTVTVKTTTGPVTRTLWSTRYGPVLTSLEGIPLPWTDAEAFAMRDGNADGMGLLLNHFLETDRAQSVAQELTILKKYQGIPWVNTIVADRDGHALYADIGSIPNVPDSLAQSCDTALGAATTQLLGLPVLDGSRSACDWLNDPDAAQPGHFGPSHLPWLERDDYVTNSNDSYWLSNPNQPITGYARIIGQENSERSLRTRLGLIMTAQQIAAGGFTRPAMQDMVFNDRVYSGELTRDAVVTLCRTLGVMAPTSSGPPVAIGNACDVLAAWDLKDDPGSRGALLFRRYWTHAVENATVTSVKPFLVPFSASDPVNTPNTLNPADPLATTAIGDAIKDVQGYGLPLDAPLSAAQYALRNGVQIPIPGGPDSHGTFNAIDGTADATKGYPDPQHGSSYVQVVTWHDATGCPDAATILTYSLSTNVRSPWYSDQTTMFSHKQWATERFCAADVRAHALSTTVLASATTSRSGPGARAARPPRVTPPAGSLAATGGRPGLPALALLAAGGALLLARRRRPRHPR